MSTPTSDIAYLSQALKAPRIRESAARLAEQAERRSFKVGPAMSTSHNQAPKELCRIDSRGRPFASTLSP